MPLCADIGILHTALLQEVAEMLQEDVASEGGSAVCCWMFVPVHGLCIRVGPPFSLFSCNENANMLKEVRLRLPLLFNQWSMMHAAVMYHCSDYNT